MASGFIARDGRDLDSIFTRATGGGGNDAGFKSPDGLDLRWRYMPGNSGVSTGFADPAGVNAVKELKAELDQLKGAAA